MASLQQLALASEVIGAQVKNSCEARREYPNTPFRPLSCGRWYRDLPNVSDFYVLSPGIWNENMRAVVPRKGPYWDRRSRIKNETTILSKIGESSTSGAVHSCHQAKFGQMICQVKNYPQSECTPW